jgi:hypothetical protein
MKNAVVFAALTSLFLGAVSHAQNLSGSILPPGNSYVVVNTGRADLDAAAYSAIADWNACLLGAKIIGIPSKGSTPGYPNQRSEIYLTPLSTSADGSTRYGEACVARQSSIYKMQSHYVAEFDVRINSAVTWTAVAFKRVVLHELGHCIGFGHPDEIGLPQPSVMRSGANHPAGALTAADIQWTKALYAWHPLQGLLLQQIQDARSIPNPIKRQREINRCQSQLDQIATTLFG